MFSRLRSVSSGVSEGFFCLIDQLGLEVDKNQRKLNWLPYILGMVLVNLQDILRSKHYDDNLCLEVLWILQNFGQQCGLFFSLLQIQKKKDGIYVSQGWLGLVAISKCDLGQKLCRLACNVLNLLGEANPQLRSYIRPGYRSASFVGWKPPWRILYQVYV